MSPVRPDDAARRMADLRQAMTTRSLDRRAFLTVDHLAAVPLAATWTDWGRTELGHAYWDHVAGRWRHRADRGTVFALPTR